MLSQAEKKIITSLIRHDVATVFIKDTNECAAAGKLKEMGLVTIEADEGSFIGGKFIAYTVKAIKAKGAE